MATYLQDGATDFSKVVQPVDYNFLNSVLGRDKANYDAGVDQVKSDYNKLINAPLTNSGNIAKRQEYLQSAKEVVQKLGKSNLRDPRNVEMAQKAFAPFWEDTDILVDTQKTQQIHSQISRAQAAEFSKDLDEKNSYNPESVKRLQWALKDLADGQRGDGSLQKVEVPNYSPYEDPTKIVADRFKEIGFKEIKRQHRNGPMLVTTVNGVEVLEEMSAMVDGALQDKSNNQFGIVGYNQYRSDLAAIQELHPSMDKAQIHQEFLKTKYQEYVDAKYTSKKNMLNDLVIKTGSTIKDLKSKSVQTTADKALIAKLEAQMSNATNSIKDIQIAYNQELKNPNGEFKTPEELMKNFHNNPEQYYGLLERQRTVNRISNMMATNNSSITEELDPLYKFESEESHRKFQDEIARMKYIHDVQQDNASNQIEREKIAKDYRINDIDPRTGQQLSSNETNSDQGIQYRGRDITNVENTGTELSTLEDIKTTALSAVNNGLFNSGFTNNLLGRLGVDDENIRIFNGYMSKRFTPENYNAKDQTWNKQEAYAYAIVSDALKNKGFIKKNKGFIKGTSLQEIVDGMGAYLTSELSQAKNINVPDSKDHDLAILLGQWANVSEAHANYKAIAHDQNAWAKHLLNTPNGRKKYSKLLNDSGDLASANDMAKDLLDLEIENPETGEIRQLTAKELANYYMHKQVNAYNDNIIINNKKYIINKVGDRVLHNKNWIDKLSPVFNINELPIAPFNNIWGNFLKKYGMNEERDALSQDLFNNMPGTNKYKSETGRLGSVFSFPVGRANKPGNNEAMIMEAFIPSNQAMGVLNDKGEALPEDQIEKLNAYINSDQTIIDKKIQAKYHNVSAYHSGMVEIPLPIDKNLGDLSGKSIKIPIAPNASGGFLSSIPTNNGISIWDKINRGETVQAQPYDKAVGFDYKLSTVNPNNKSNYRLKWSYTTIDPTTGKEAIVNMPDVAVDLNTVTPDNLMQTINQKRIEAINHLYNARAAQAQKINANAR